MVTAEIAAPAGPAKKRKAGAWPPRSRGYKVFRVVNAIILILVVLAVLLPFLNLLAQSFSSEKYITQGRSACGRTGFNVTTYEHVMSDPQFWSNYRNTVLYTVCSTAVAMVLTTCYAYVLSRKQLRGRKVLIGIAIVTMFFNGGIIPNYILVSSLHLRDTVWAYALPNAIVVFNLLVMKTFFESLPTELEEAAAIDGLNTYRTLWRIVLPLSKAVLATIALFYAVMFWNDWFSALPLHGQPGTLPRLPVPSEHRRLAQQRVQHRAVRRHPAADRGQHPGRDGGSRRRADPLRLPLHSALLRFWRHARRR